MEHYQQWRCRLTKRQRKKIESEYWSVKEYAEKMDVHEDTIYSAIKRGEIKAIRVGRCWRIRKTDV